MSKRRGLPCVRFYGEPCDPENCCGGRNSKGDVTLRADGEDDGTGMSTNADTIRDVLRQPINGEYSRELAVRSLDALLAERDAARAGLLAQVEARQKLLAESNLLAQLRGAAVDERRELEAENERLRAALTEIDHYSHMGDGAWDAYLHVKTIAAEAVRAAVRG